MYKLFAAVTAIVLTFSACDTVTSYWNKPETQQAVQALEQWAIQQVTDYFAGHLMLGTKKLTPRRYSVPFVEQQLVVQAQVKFPSLSREVIQAKVHEAFTKNANYVR